MTQLSSVECSTSSNAAVTAARTQICQRMSSRPVKAGLVPSRARFDTDWLSDKMVVGCVSGTGINPVLIWPINLNLWKSITFSLNSLPQKNYTWRHLDFFWLELSAHLVLFIHYTSDLVPLSFPYKSSYKVLNTSQITHDAILIYLG